MSKRQSEVNRFLNYCLTLEHEETKTLVRDQVQDFFRHFLQKRKAATAKSKNPVREKKPTKEQAEAAAGMVP